MYKITVGERPEWSIYYRDGTKIQPDPDRKLLFLAPGETVEVPVADYLVAIRDRIEEKMLFSKVSRVTLSRHNFYFADGMRWDANSRGYYVPETGRPGHYTKLAETFSQVVPPFQKNSLRMLSRNERADELQEKEGMKVAFISVARLFVLVGVFVSEQYERHGQQVLRRKRKVNVNGCRGSKVAAQCLWRPTTHSNL